MELATTSTYDVLAVSGAASLAGKLDIHLLNPAALSWMSRFDNFDSYGSHTGQFDTIDLTGAAPGMGIAPVYGADGLDLVYARLGDANLDGAVTLSDLVTVRRNTGLTGSRAVWQSGDFDHDGRVNAHDLSSSRSATTPPEGNPPSDGDLGTAFLATEGESFALTQIELAVRHRSGSAGFDLFLMGDNWVGNKETGYAPDVLHAPDGGTVLEQFRVTAPILSTGIVTVRSQVHPFLDANHLYWLVISATGDNSGIAWWGAPLELMPQPTLIAERYNNALCRVSESEAGPGCAFRVSGEAIAEPPAVPLPAAVWAGAALLFGYGARHSLRRHSVEQEA